MDAARQVMDEFWGLCDAVTMKLGGLVPAAKTTTSSRHHDRSLDSHHHSHHDHNHHHRYNDDEDENDNFVNNARPRELVDDAAPRRDSYRSQQRRPPYPDSPRHSDRRAELQQEELGAPRRDSYQSQRHVEFQEPKTERELERRASEDYAQGYLDGRRMEHLDQQRRSEELRREEQGQRHHHHHEPRA